MKKKIPSHENSELTALISFLSILLFIFIYLYFIDYAITVVPLHPAPPTPSGNPHHCSCPGIIHVSSLAILFPILYLTSPWLFINYLFVLVNPLISSPFLTSPSHVATIKTLSVSMILSLFLFAYFVF